MSALDYLLKSIVKDELIGAVEKTTDGKQEGSSQQSVLQMLLQHPDATCSKKIAGAHP